MSKSYFWLLCACLCSFSVLGVEYPQSNRVRHDPFQRPVIPQQQSIVETEASKPSAHELWAPKLTATLRAGRNSMADVNGKIIKLGETIDGYKLIEVDERSAVFIKNKKRTQLTIDVETNE
jgi:hypothetical protein